MRPDLVVPGENEENFVVARDARVVTVPFSPIEKRFAKEKPQLMPGLQKLREELGDAEFDRLITRIHNINVRTLPDCSRKRTASYLYFTGRPACHFQSV